MMRAKDRGTRFESAVVSYLREHGFPHVERRALFGSLDRGDVSGLPGWVLQLRDHGTLAFGPWLRETEQQARNANAKFFAVVAKRRRSPGCSGAVSEAFVVMPLRVFTDLLAADQVEDGAA